MTFTNHPTASIDDLLYALRKSPYRWAIPALLTTLLSIAYLPFYKPPWTARQALTVREEAGSRGTHLGRFASPEDLRNAQETIVELARNPSVVTTALRQLGPPPSCKRPDQWPTAEDVEAAQETIHLTPPNGVEFGTTEFFYLDVQDTNRQRAIEFSTVLADCFEQRLKQLRDAKAQSVLEELFDKVQLASEERKKTTAQLANMETSVGSDLAELRALNQSSLGQSDIQSSLIEVRQELRLVETARLNNRQLIELLIAAQQDPSELIATPNRLLEAQPALRRLKEGLVDAQINSSQLLGTMSTDHPRVLASQVAEDEIRGHLHRELELALRGLNAEQEMHQARLESLSIDADRLQGQLENLASIRASYGNLVSEASQRTDNLMQAQQDLADARASHAAAQSSSLLTRIDTPQTGPRPSGPGRGVIVAAGALGGLILGCGIAFLTTVPQSAEPKLASQSGLGQSEPPPLAATTTAAAPQPNQTNPITTPRPLPVPANGPTKHLTMKQALAQCADKSGFWN